jgi:feruloyl esterase
MLMSEALVRRLIVGLQFALLALALCVGGVTAARAEHIERCEALSGFTATDLRISAAANLPAAAQWAAEPGAPPITNAVAFCRVQGIIETEIGFELWLPEPRAWNGKFLGAGVGGDAGRFNFRDLARGVARGYASASTDTGHKASEKTWMLGDPMRLVNFQLRANHLLVEASRKIISAYYSAPLQHRYFIGCSGGGRQGLKEMQRFPKDYEGIIAGAPGPNTTEMTTRRMWEILQRDAHPGLMSKEDWLFVAREGVSRCEAVEGDSGDPRGCGFRPAALGCDSTHQAPCLNPDQVAFAEALYGPLRDENGRQLDEGLLPGVLVDAGRSPLALATFGQAIRRLPDWNGQDFHAAADSAAIDRVMPELRADDANLEPFRRSGGKAILYQGWLDPAVAARMTLEYFEQVQKVMGGEKRAQSFIRLFMVPGMLHCMGGDVPDQFGGSGADAPTLDADHDMLSALERWVEHGKPPQSLIASQLSEGRVTRTRLLCPSAQIAHYTGQGPRTDAKNFTCSSEPRSAN